MEKPLNYRHLHYFWIAAQEGSFTRAAEKLGVAVQTVSAQIGLLERTLGASLLVQQGRRLVPTEAGRVAMDHASQIFELGAQLRTAINDATERQALRLTVGIADALPKLFAYRLLSGLQDQPDRVRLVCLEGDFEDLIADLALHRFDLLLTDRPAGTGRNLRVYSHLLDDHEIALFGTRSLVDTWRPRFPGKLERVPLLLPTRDNALRTRLDQWFAARAIRPLVVGEYEDSALLMTFGRSGIGLFPAPTLLTKEIAEQFDAIPLGVIEGVREQFYAITADRRIRHPAVEAILGMGHTR